MRPFAVAVLYAALFGCSAPSSVDLCHSDCDFQKLCPGAQTPLPSSCQALSLVNCHSCCDAMAGTLLDTDSRDDANCRNSGNVRSGTQNCLTGACASFQNCISGLDNTCIHFQ